MSSSRTGIANLPLIETSSDGVTHLKPGESWDFEINCSGGGCDKAEDYKIEAAATTSQNSPL